ncbi:MAG: hypothetical protein HYT79_12565, partial [Elusimicrobia bacterium]|nr:hypothetical protein [Elusimicrobiota bacterium]
MSEQKTAPDSPELLSNWQQLLKQINEHAAPVPNAEDLKKSELFINRELSWLDFNDRVLNEAADATVPPLERLRFVAIVSSNLDEFFMIRVAEIARTVAADPGQRYPDGLKASEVYGQIRERVLAQKTRQAQVFSEIIETLRQNGIEIHAHFNGDTELDAGIKERLPLVKIFLRQAKDAFPALPAGRIHVFVRFAKEYAILSIEDKAGRLIELPGSRRFALAERWLCAKAAELFPGREVIEAFPFKIIREANMRVRPEDEETLEEQIIQGLEGRSRGKPVRLEVDAPQYSEGAFFLATTLRLDSAAMYRFDLPLDLMTLMRIYDSDERDLRYPAIEPKLPSPLENPQRMFALLRRHDILLHHPYDSFDAIVNLMDQAARDPQVKRIYHTIYRAGQQSPLMESLKEACRQGKKVTVYVEIKARFDELNNMRWMSELKKAGASVVPALGHFKVHSKVTQIIREENGGEVSYLHLGTGNYHPKTARQYTDLGLLTSDATLGSDISAFFETISR